MAILAENNAISIWNFYTTPMNRRIFSTLPLLLLLLVSCGKDAVTPPVTSEPALPSAPDELALYYLQSVEQGEVEGLDRAMYFSSEYDRKRYQGYFDRVKSLKEKGLRRELPSAGFQVSETAVNGDTAVVRLNGRNAFDKNTTVEVRLLSVNGKWKIDASYPLAQRKKKK